MTNIMNLIAIVLTLAALAAAVAAVGSTVRTFADRYTGGLVTALVALVVTLPCAVGTVTFFAAIAVALQGPEYVFAVLACGAVGMKVAWVVSMVLVEMALELLEDKGFITFHNLKELREGADPKKKRWYKR